MAWTPSDLTRKNFVDTQLSAKDRSFALNTVTNELTGAESRLTNLEAELAAAQAAANNGPSRGQINELKAKAGDTSLSAEERTTALTESTRLANERARLNVAADNALNKFNSTREYVSTLAVGQSNLLQAGAVPPGTNSFAPPPGYEGRNSPAAQVSDSENPNPAPTPTAELLQQAVPNTVTVTGVTVTPVLPQTQTASTTLDGLDPGEATQAELDAIRTEQQKQAEQLQTETDLGATQAELDAIRAEEQKQAEEAQGATQEELAAITIEQQRQAEIQTAQEETDVINAEQQKQAEQLQTETDLGATQDEINAIRVEEQKQAEESQGATQDELAAINAEQEAQRNSEAASELTREGRRGLPGAVNNAREQAISQDVVNFNQIPDWRVRLSLAPGATYLYRSPNPGILKPLQATDGVIFPYTPSIQMGYSAAYDAFDVTHSNYKIYQYKNSSVDQINITAEFTAQDATEAAYMLAVIHFFRSVTKMFYGKDQNPIAGTPPPLCYIYGLGDFQFNQHPLLISNFTYSLPTDVDYIRAGAPTLQAGQSSAGYSTTNNSSNPSTTRMQTNNVPFRASAAAPNWTTQTNIEPTYVPTKIQLTIAAWPIVTRKDISNNFSVKEYATGALLRGRQNSNGGIW